MISISEEEYALLPSVSILTPTMPSRKKFTELAFMNIVGQMKYYPKIVQWIVYDDYYTEEWETMVKRFPFGEYHQAGEKLTIGDKRQRLLDLARGDIVVSMDDDDVYNPHYVESVVGTLIRVPECSMVGIKDILVYDCKLKMIIQKPRPKEKITFGHGSLCFWNDLHQKYDKDDKYYEESKFTNNFMFPVMQLDPRLTLVVNRGSSENTCRYVSDVEYEKYNFTPAMIDGKEITLKDINPFISDEMYQRIFFPQ